MLCVQKETIETFVKKFVYTAMILLIATSYLLLEAQSWLYLVDSLKNVISPDEMQRREDIGYTTASIGVALIFIQYGLNKAKNGEGSTTLSIATVLSPAVYLVAFVAIYMTIEHSWAVVSKDNKPKALKASLYSLTNPQEAGVSPFYLFADFENMPSERALARDFVSLYPTSDGDIIRAFRYSISSLGKFSSLYDINYATLNDHIALARSHKERPSIDKYIEREKEARAKEAVYTLAVGKVGNNNALIKPYDFPSLYGNLLNAQMDNDEMFVLYKRLARRVFNAYTNKESDIIPTALSPSCPFSFSINLFHTRRGGDCVARVENVEFAHLGVKPNHDSTVIIWDKTIYKEPELTKEINARYLAWRFGLSATDIGQYNLNQDQFELFKHALTNELLGEYVHGDTMLAPINTRTRAGFWNSSAVREIVTQNAPFLIQDGDFIVKLDRLSEDRYLNNALSFADYNLGKARELWESSQVRDLTQLMVDDKYWTSVWSEEVYAPILKQGVILPVMLVVSLALIAFNASLIVATLTGIYWTRLVVFGTTVTFVSVVGADSASVAIQTVTPDIMADIADKLRAIALYT